MAGQTQFNALKAENKYLRKRVEELNALLAQFPRKKVLSQTYRQPGQALVRCHCRARSTTSPTGSCSPMDAYEVRPYSGRLTLVIAADIEENDRHFYECGLGLGREGRDLNGDGFFPRVLGKDLRFTH